jgi:hypothetical protein
MVSTPVGTTAFDGHNVLRLFDHAEQMIISAHIGTQWTGIFFSKMKTTRAKPGSFLQLPNGISQRASIVQRPPQNVKRQSGSGFSADTGQFGKLDDESVKRWGKFYHVD